MKYFGGKARISGDIAKYINYRIKPGQAYWEPFCGSCWVMSKISGGRKRIASDLHPSLIMMWKALQEGWIPPDEVSEEDYYRVKNTNDCALKSFVGFGCSFAGRYFEGYARDKKSDRNFAAETKRSLFAKMRFLNNVLFIESDYREYSPPENSFIYCDPPYVNRKWFSSLDKFNSDQFWLWAESKSNQGHTVLVSEYSSPKIFTSVWEKQTKTDIRNGSGVKEKRVEKLFELKVA